MYKNIIRRQLPNKKLVFSSDLSPLLQHIYALRGISSKEELDYTTGNLLKYDSFSGMSDAVEILFQALKNQHKIMIVGDFDTDGATSTALIIRALRKMGAQYVDYIIPDRFEDGYGLSVAVVKKAIEKNAQLIITVDNGISSIDAVNYAKQYDLMVIITDHHLAPNTLPIADAIINPNIENCRFPSKNLAGVGVTFYFMLALRAKLRQENGFFEKKNIEYNLAHLLDLVALGTIADVVKLDRNNRILVHQGIARIRAGESCAGIKALLEITKKNFANVTAQDLAFYIAPRINAAGRMDNMSLSVELLLCDDDKIALHLASELDTLNADRKMIEQTMHEEAINFMQKMENDQKEIPNSIVVYHPEWHQGIIGILSSRLKEKYYRPVISFAATEDGFLKGSGRSIKGIHLRDVLDTISIQNPKLIVSFGGHAMAAGLTIKEKDLSLFSHCFESAINDLIDSSLLQPVIETDGEVDSQYFTYDVAKQLKESGPWGEGFPAPLFDGEFTLHQQKLFADKHLRLVLEPNDKGILVEGIVFNVNRQEWPDQSIKKVKLVYQLESDDFRGNQSIKLIIRHIWPIA